MTVHDLPALNAAFNASSALCLVAGWVCIRKRKVPAHRACMVLALGLSAAFLASYLTYHFRVGSVRFPGHGWIRPVYFAILATHSVLAAAIVPLVIVTVRRALRRDFQRHARVARWTLPMWLYVSVTGVVVYWLLYRVYGARAPL